MDEQTAKLAYATEYDVASATRILPTVTTDVDGNTSVSDSIAGSGVASSGSQSALANPVTQSTVPSVLTNAIDAAGHFADDALNTKTKIILKDFTFASTDFAGAIKTGTIVWDPTTGAITSGSGGLFNSLGLVFAHNGVPTITLDGTTGDAVFGGTLIAANGTLGTIRTGLLLTTYFGDGSNGDVSTGSDMYLSQDVYYNNLTINTGHTIYTNGYRIFVCGTLTWNGNIINNGGDGGNGAGGVATITYAYSDGGVGGAGGGLVGSSFGQALSGGTGGYSLQQLDNDTDEGAVGANGTPVNPSLSSNGGKGGGGGWDSGNNAAGMAGGSAGVATTEKLTFRFGLLDVANNGQSDQYSNIAASLNLSTSVLPAGVTSGFGLSSGANGAGGGAGKAVVVSSCPNSYNYVHVSGGGGGGGGGAGGVIYLAAYNIVASGGSFQAKGGNGGSGGSYINSTGHNCSVNTASGGGGGGGGGAGGVIILFYHTGNYPNPVVTGGTGGSHGNSGGTAGGDGDAGANGKSYLFRV